ncbi:hypothetical protein KCP73_16530 [Salmonella enterica subsp. enterica]|nr:hypothetical protein KCP73_16530 [Salmonella enterica subsp. enterica]
MRMVHRFYHRHFACVIPAWRQPVTKPFRALAPNARPRCGRDRTGMFARAVSDPPRRCV